VGLIGRRLLDVVVQQIRGLRQRVIRVRSLGNPATTLADTYPVDSHQPCDTLSAELIPVRAQFHLNARIAVGTTARLVNLDDPLAQHLVGAFTRLLVAPDPGILARSGDPKVSHKTVTG